jgi:hypothetical protein|tara:strand:- start:134 stop:505 length:372 start_codon:yes stop_codon:yes gene_type:complete
VLITCIFAKICLYLHITKRKSINPKYDAQTKTNRMKTYSHPETNKPMSKDDYFLLMFGKLFMDSKDKGKIKQYDEKEQLIEKVEQCWQIKENWNADEIKTIPNLTLKELREISQEIDEMNADA